MTAPTLRLIVDESGKRRVFKVSPGKLALGTGESARLKLADSTIAAHHADLEITPTRAILTVLGGESRAEIDGVAQEGDVVLEPGSSVRLGAVRLTFEVDEPREPAPERDETRTARPRARSGGNLGTRPVVITRGDDPGDKPRKRKLPISTIVIAVLAVLAAGIPIVASMTAEDAPTESDRARAALASAIDDANAQRWEDVERKIASIDLGKVTDAPTADKISTLRQRIAEWRERVQVDLKIASGNGFLENKLKRYEENFLRGEPKPAEVRVFLERCKEFRERWPGHPQIEWVDRYERRFAGVVDISQPRHWDDVDFEVRLLTHKIEAPDWRRVFAILDEYRSRARVQEHPKIDELIEKQKNGRLEWFNDRLAASKSEYDRGLHNKSFGKLVDLVVFSGDASLVQNALKRLVAFPKAEDHLRGYAEHEPELYVELVSHPSVASLVARRQIVKPPQGDATAGR